MVHETTIVALGSQDRGVSVWSTSSSRAIASAQDLFRHSVLDLAWSPCGSKLFACSYDGTIAILEFDVSDFGSPVSGTDLTNMLGQYGMDRRNIIPESAEQLKIQQRIHEQARDQLDDRMQTDLLKTPSKKVPTPKIVNPLPTVINQPTLVPAKQTVTMTKDGRKRIQPVFLQGGSPLQTSKAANMPLISRPAESQQIGSETICYTLPVIQETKRHVNLSMPGYRSTFSASIDIDGINSRRILECKNSKKHCRLQFSVDADLQWATEYPHSALAACIVPLFVAVAYSDCSLLIYSHIGTRLFPPMRLESGVSFMVARDDYLLYLNCIGSIYMWNIGKRYAILADISVCGLLDQQETIVKLLINDKAPMITTSKQVSWLYDTSMRSWMQVAQPNAARRIESAMFGNLNRSLPTLDQIEVALFNPVEPCLVTSFGIGGLLVLAKSVRTEIG